jgi:peptidoglycan/xylan/chitin deacetylase (PgdA/CDA1 family)/LysM repeat protein
MPTTDVAANDGRVRVSCLAAMAVTIVAVCIPQVISGVPRARAASCPAPIQAVLDYTPPTLERTVALTFDDGPLPQNTPQVLDVLRARGVKATFFVTGSNVSAHPELVRRIVAEGHAIGNHTWSHSNLDQLSPAGQAAEMDRTTQAIVTATGIQPCFFRGPYGIHRSASVTSLAWERGMTIADWSHDTRDWETPSDNSPSFQDRIAERATVPDSAHPIVLMHDGGGYRQNTVAALDRIISSYVARGFVFTDPAGRPLQGGPAVGGSGSAEPGSGGTYTVRPGDTLSAIAARYGTDWQQLYAANRTAIGPDPAYLRVGQQLTVPGADVRTPSSGSSSGSTAGSPYIVRPGDTLSAIAARYGTNWQQLYAANRTAIGPDPAYLRVGQQLTIPSR